MIEKQIRVEGGDPSKDFWSGFVKNKQHSWQTLPDAEGSSTKSAGDGRFPLGSFPSVREFL